MIRFAVSGLVAVAAALLGVSLLWVGNPTWGSVGDWLAAILWGLGLQAARTNVLASISTLTGQIGGKQ
jgi:hypothetical protein